MMSAMSAVAAAAGRGLIMIMVTYWVQLRLQIAFASVWLSQEGRSDT